jgi:hypothetical protein
VNPRSEEAAQQSCDCHRFFKENEDSKKLATQLEEQHPRCLCEKFSVGHNSPGPVEDTESLHRIIASPRDYDPLENKIFATPFEKVFSNGLSVWRAVGPDEDVRILMVEALSRKPDGPKKEVFSVCELRADEVRNMTNESGEKLFCIYDQTVTRAQDPGLPPVPTHAGIFLRAFPPAGTADRKKMLRDYALLLYDKFVAGRIPAADYRGGLCVDLNQRAQSGEFDRSE